MVANILIVIIDIKTRIVNAAASKQPQPGLFLTFCFCSGNSTSILYLNTFELVLGEIFSSTTIRLESIVG
jgi:Ni,Fe-hydrogenase I small subunit